MNLKMSSMVMGKRLTAVLVAIATALGMATVAAPQASADTRGVLRPGCTWSPYKYYVQDCWVSSPSMGQKIKVQIQAASRGGSAGVYFLDGLRAPEHYSDWVELGHAPRKFVNDNVTLAMPVGGKGQFYTDWQGHWGGTNGPRTPRWETFLTRELPNYLAREFGVSRTNNSVVGLSMGAMAAMNLAAWHRNQFKQVTSMSGYLNPTFPGMYFAMNYSMQDSSGPGARVENMWGPPASPARFRNDPTLNVGRLQGMPMYLSAALGGPTPDINFVNNPVVGVSAVMLEFFSRTSTRKFEIAARGAGINPVVSYSPVGVHNWNNWGAELHKARPHILRALGA
ncbi:esterase family protein [Corynebacterium urealyticum]|uniref:Esterase family protein n=3 Tax=Corynebacterium urealyticum TaxID=43771 RepID=A0A5D4FV72_9CORY|nr:esterase family protein [Corynebacterium urealyticum]